MYLSEDDVIKVKQLFNADGLLSDPPSGGYSGNWDQTTQDAYNAYVVKHESDLSHILVNQQPGTIEAMGRTMQHAWNEGVSLAKAAEVRVKGWFSFVKTKVEKTEAEIAAEAKKLKDEAEAKAKELAAKAKAEAEALAAKVKAEEEKVKAAALAAEQAAKGTAAPAPAPTPASEASTSAIAIERGTANDSSAATTTDTPKS